MTVAGIFMQRFLTVLLLCVRGTLPYMAPELVSDPMRVSEKADVWSLGMVLWEMLTLQVPFGDLTPQQIVAGLMVGNLQPPVRGDATAGCIVRSWSCDGSEMVLHHGSIHTPASSAHLEDAAVAPLQIPEWCESSWQSLLEACWEVSPSARPHLRDLVRLDMCLFGSYSNCGARWHWCSIIVCLVAAYALDFR